MNWEIGIGHFYPDDFEVHLDWMRPVDPYEPWMEFSHERCPKDDPKAIEVWWVAYVPKKREWRDGSWRRVKVAA